MLVFQDTSDSRSLESGFSLSENLFVVSAEHIGWTEVIGASMGTLLVINGDEVADHHERFNEGGWRINLERLLPHGPVKALNLAVGLRMIPRSLHRGNAEA